MHLAEWITRILHRFSSAEQQLPALGRSLRGHALIPADESLFAIWFLGVITLQREERNPGRPPTSHSECYCRRDGTLIDTREAWRVSMAIPLFGRWHLRVPGAQ